MFVPKAATSSSATMFRYHSFASRRAPRAILASFVSKSELSYHPRRFLNVASRPTDLIGHTPLLDLTKVLKAHGVDNGSVLYGKMESMEPCSSVKDRLGKSMIDAAEAAGMLGC